MSSDADLKALGATTKGQGGTVCQTSNLTPASRATLSRCYSGGMKGTTVLEQHENGEFTKTIEPADLRAKHTKSAALWVPTVELSAWQQNPRDNDHAVPEVVKSIKRFGFAAPIIASPDGQIIAGHTRLKAALELRMPEVPVRFMDLDPGEAHLLALADNRIAEIADWDDDLLGDVLKDMEADGLDLGGIGWDVDELADLLGQNDPLPMEEDEVPEIQAEVHSKLGEVYELGPHRLMCGDCRASTDVSTLLDGVVVNVAFTSPPYASQRKYDESSGFKPIKPDAYVEWFETVQANVREHLAEDGSWFVNIKEHCEDGQRSLYVKDLTIAHVRAWGWMFVDEFCWRDTKNGVPGGWGNRFKDAWEPVFHFATTTKIRMDPTANGTESNAVFDYSPSTATTKTGSGLLGVKSTEERQGVARPSNVIEIAAASTGEHSAAYPVGLPSWFVRAFSDEGDAILDPFMGSGTTLIAAAQERRVAYGMEISPGYCDVIRRRWTRWARDHDQDPGTGALED